MFYSRFKVLVKITSQKNCVDFFARSVQIWGFDGDYSSPRYKEGQFPYTCIVSFFPFGSRTVTELSVLGF